MRAQDADRKRRLLHGEGGLAPSENSLPGLTNPPSKLEFEERGSLSYDSGAGHGRPIIFGTAGSADLLIASDHWGADGTFRVNISALENLWGC